MRSSPTLSRSSLTSEGRPSSLAVDGDGCDEVAVGDPAERCERQCDEVTGRHRLEDRLRLLESLVGVAIEVWRAGLSPAVDTLDVRLRPAGHEHGDLFEETQGGEVVRDGVDGGPLLRALPLSRGVRNTVAKSSPTGSSVRAPKRAARALCNRACVSNHVAPTSLAACCDIENYPDLYVCTPVGATVEVLFCLSRW